MASLPPRLRAGAAGVVVVVRAGVVSSARPSCVLLSVCLARGALRCARFAVTPLGVWAATPPPPQADAAPAARLPLFMIPLLLSARKSFFAILWTILAPLQRDSEKFGNKAHQHPHILPQYRLFRVFLGQPICKGVQLCSAYIRVL